MFYFPDDPSEASYDGIYETNDASAYDWIALFKREGDADIFLNARLHR